MNRQIRNYVSVAIAFLLGLGLIVYGVVWLSGALHPHYAIYAVFDDAKGMQASEFIRMAGIDIGQVADVGLDETGRKAKLALSIDSQYKIPRNSKFQISGGLLGAQGILSILPSNETAYVQPGETVQGDNSDIFGALTSKAPAAMESAQQTMVELQRTMRAMQPTLRDSHALVVKYGRLADDMDRSLNTLAGPNGRLNSALANADAASAKLPGLIDTLQGQLATLSVQTNQLMAGLQTTEHGANKVIDNAGQLTTSMNGVITENRAALRSIIRSADDAAGAVAAITDQLKQTVNNPQTQANIHTATQNLVDITTRLDNTAAGLERLSSDPRMTSDLRETVSNIRDTSASIRDVAARIDTIHIPGEKRPAPETGGDGASERRKAKPLSYVALYQPGLALDSSYDTTWERYRLDANYTLMSRKPGSFYRAGLYDATEKNRLNLQAGHSLGNFAALRYGLVDGKLGTGLDLDAGPFGFGFDFFDPNRFTINARGRLYLGPNTALTGGVDSLGHENRAVIGITIRK